MTTDTISLALLRGSAEHLYDFCAKQQDKSLEHCMFCPLHLACSQARCLNYSSLEDLMGMILYSIQVQQRAAQEAGL